MSRFWLLVWILFLAICVILRLLGRHLGVLSVLGQGGWMTGAKAPSISDVLRSQFKCHSI